MNNGLHTGVGADESVIAGPLKARRKIQEGTSRAHSGGRYVVDLSRGTLHHIPLHGHTTLVFPELQAGVGFTLLIQQGSSAFSVVWPSTVKWADGIAAPAISSSPGKVDVLTFLCHPNGQSWMGFLGGRGYS